ncbi:MAG: redoxin domain-containing protein [Candidatus Nanopelagicales bacterium]
MTDRTAAHQKDAERRHHLGEIQEDQARAARKRRALSLAAWAVGLVLVAGIIAAGLLSSKPQDRTAGIPTPAPTFTLTDTTGDRVDLAGFRGRNVILYFSEGAGCQSCLLQMAQIENKQAEFDAANITVLPIVMNTKDQITADMAANNVQTPFLLDDGTVSTEYGTIGRGMHAGLPGHSFVVIDTNGMQRWYGEYPSMWLEPADLLAKAQAALSS